MDSSPETATLILSPADRRELIRALKGQGSVIVEFTGGRALAVGPGAMVLEIADPHARLRAAFDELTTHGDLTPAGRDKLVEIIGGDNR